MHKQKYGEKEIVLAWGVEEPAGGGGFSLDAEALLRRDMVKMTMKKESGEQRSMMKTSKP